MPFSSARLVVALTFILTPILGAPTTPLIAVETYSGTTKPNSYIVTLKDNVSKSDHLDWLSQQVGTDGVTHPEWQSDFLNGFAGLFDFQARMLVYSLINELGPTGEFSSDTLDLLRSNTDVQSIAEDGIVTIDTLVTQYGSFPDIALFETDLLKGMMHLGELHV